MPTLSLTVTTEVATRIQAAYGASSLADLKTKIIEDIRSRTISYEIQQVEEAEQAKIRTAQEAKEALLHTTHEASSTAIQLT